MNKKTKRQRIIIVLTAAVPVAFTVINAAIVSLSDYDPGFFYMGELLRVKLPMFAAVLLSVYLAAALFYMRCGMNEPGERKLLTGWIFVAAMVVLLLLLAANIFLITESSLENPVLLTLYMPAWILSVCPEIIIFIDLLSQCSGAEKRIKTARRLSIVSAIVLFLLNITVLAGLDHLHYEAYESYDAKPVIYLYPEEETAVSVKLELSGEMTCSYPAYDGGWHVTASPDGTLQGDDGQTYNYLYWEGESAAAYDFSEGFCVAGSDTAAFLEKALARLGLTRREANEFIVYWLPLMQNNPCNLISFQTDAYTGHAGLTIDPAPDTLIRVFMAWKPAETGQDIHEQTLNAPDRTGFTVVEWGGCKVK